MTSPLEHVRMTDYDALVLPGGQINPDLLRLNSDAIRLIRESSRPAPPSPPVWATLPGC